MPARFSAPRFVKIGRVATNAGSRRWLKARDIRAGAGHRPPHHDISSRRPVGRKAPILRLAKLRQPSNVAVAFPFDGDGYRSDDWTTAGLFGCDLPLLRASVRTCAGLSERHQERNEWQPAGSSCEAVQPGRLAQHRAFERIGRQSQYGNGPDPAAGRHGHDPAIAKRARAQPAITIRALPGWLHSGSSYRPPRIRPRNFAFRTLISHCAFNRGCGFPRTPANIGSHMVRDTCRRRFRRLLGMKPVWGTK